MKALLSILFIAGCLPVTAQITGNFKDEKTNLYGFKDKAGKIIVAPKYNAVSYLSEGAAAIKLNDKWGFINDKGVVIIPPQYDQVQAFSEGWAAVAKDSAWDAGGDRNTRWGYIDKNNKLVLPFKYNRPGSFKHGYAIISTAYDYFTLFGIIDRKANEITATKWSALEDLSEGYFLAAVGDISSYKGKYGFLDNTGKVAISFIYDGAMSFSEGLACVKQGKKWGFIDKKGTMLIPVQFDSPGYFEKGKAEVMKDGQSFFINPKGERLK